MAPKGAHTQRVGSCWPRALLAPTAVPHKEGTHTTSPPPASFALTALSSPNIPQIHTKTCGEKSHWRPPFSAAIEPASPMGCGWPWAPRKKPLFLLGVIQDMVNRDLSTRFSLGKGHFLGAGGSHPAARSLPCHLARTVRKALVNPKARLLLVLAPKALRGHSSSLALCSLARAPQTPGLLGDGDIPFSPRLAAPWSHAAISTCTQSHVPIRDDEIYRCWAASAPGTTQGCLGTGPGPS